MERTSSPFNCMSSVATVLGGRPALKTAPASPRAKTGDTRRFTQPYSIPACGCEPIPRQRSRRSDRSLPPTFGLLLQSSNEIHFLQPCLLHYRYQRSLSQLRMIRHCNDQVSLLIPEVNMASSLAIDSKAKLLQGLDYILS